MSQQTLKEVLRRFGSSVHFDEIPREVRQKIHELCADFVGGAWDRTRPEDLKIEQLMGGMSNLIFHCALPNSEKTPTSSTPNELLIRIYFNPNTENRVVEESVVFNLLAERNLGPKLYGVFADGRLEEYVQARPLSTPEIGIPAVSAKIARITAQIHQLVVPVKKKPTSLGDSMKKWMTQLRSLYKAKNSNTVVVAQSSRLEKTLTLDQLESEIELVIRCMQRSPSPVVFCHNDLQEGNFLFKNSDSDLETANFSVIDYEYSSYNHRSFDIANHFCEWTFDYHANTDCPYFAWNQDSYPKIDQQLLFAENYLREVAKLSRNDDPVSPEAVESLMDEIKTFVPVSHFFWGVWALLLAETSPVQFGFAEYARCRLELYYRLRNDLLNLLDGQENHVDVHADEPNTPGVVISNERVPISA